MAIGSELARVPAIAVLICSSLGFWLKKGSMGGKQGVLSAQFSKHSTLGQIEDSVYGLGYHRVAGLDEVGRGPLAGPVVAAGIILPPGFSHPGIKDSKMLTVAQRERVAPIIRENAVSWAVGVVEVEEIDRLNILNASLLAMAKACDALKPAPDYLLIDGSYTLPWRLLRFDTQATKPLPEQRNIVRGDRLCLSIAAASILAKVARDELMVALDKEYPEYGFAKHKGYGSAAHLLALRRLGPSPAHRRSFKPVRDLCEGGSAGVAEPLFTKE